MCLVGLKKNKKQVADQGGQDHEQQKRAEEVGLDCLTVFLSGFILFY